MTASPFNSIGGFSAGIPAVNIVDANGNITTNVLTTGNVAANVFYGSFYKYANGNPIAAGSNTQLQFINGSNVFAASANLTFNNSTNNLSIGGNIIVSGNTNSSGSITDTFQLGSGNSVFKTEAVYLSSTTGSVVQTLYEVSTDDISGVDAHIIATSGNATQIVKISAVINGNTAVATETFNSSVGGELGDFSVTINTGELVLSVSTLTANTIDYKYLITVYPQ